MHPYRVHQVLGVCALVLACSRQSTSAPDTPEGQAPVASYTDLTVTVRTPEGVPLAGAQIVVRVFSKTSPPSQRLSGSGLSNSTGAYRFSRASMTLGGWYPSTITLTAPVGSGLRDTTLTDSTEWVSYPAPSRTLIVTLQR